MNDRTVHGTGISDGGTGYDVARYDRAGTWWLEYHDGRRKRICLADAVRATQEVRLNRPGGLQFDARWRRAHPEDPR